jgi:hypothetical protein
VFKLLCNVGLCFSDQQKIQNEVGSIPYEAVSRDGDDRTQEWNPGASPLIPRLLLNYPFLCYLELPGTHQFRNLCALAALLFVVAKLGVSGFAARRV